MKRFEFRLERVLGYRQKLEEQRHQLFGRALQMVQTQQAGLLALYQLVSQAKEEMRGQSRSTVDVQALRQQRVYLGTVTRQVAVALKRLRTLEHELDRCRRMLIEARKDRRALELLREKRRADHEVEAGREAQKELDEVAARAAVMRETAG